MSQMWYKIQAKRQIYERKYAMMFRRVLMDQAKPVIDYLKAGNDPRGMNEIVDILVNDDTVKQPLVDLYKEVGYAFVKMTPKLVKANDEFERTFWEQELERIALEEIGIKITSITGTNKKNILRIVRKTTAKGIAEGWGIDEITRNLLKDIQTFMPHYTRIQARTIAQTEVIQSSNKATWEAGKQLGIPVEKYWHTAPGAGRTERHTLPGAVDEYQKPMGAKFLVDGGSGPVPMDHPGDPAGGVENIANCYCAMSFVPIEN